MQSPLRVDVKAVREEAIKRAAENLKYARTGIERHEARLALQRARRAIGKGGARGTEE